MSLYKVIIADDEEELRNGIIRKIDWYGNGFEVVGSAENGQEAYDLCKKYHPDLVITDIKMPFMTGLELGEKLYDTMPHTKVVIFSGFDDFEYAQKAIKINAYEYILKPIDSLKLTELLKKIKEQLDAELFEKRNIEVLRENYKRSLPILQQQFLTRLIEGRVAKEKVMDLAIQYDLELWSNFWVVSVVHAEFNSDNNNEDVMAFKNDMELVPLSLQSIVDENLKNSCDFKSFLYNEEVVIIGKLKNENQIMEFVNQMNKICRTAKYFIGLSVSAGVGAVCDTITGIKTSYNGAKTALDYRVIMSDKAIYIGDMEPDFSKQLQFDEEESRALMNAIKLEGSESIKSIVLDIVKKFKDSRVQKSQYQIYLTELLSDLFKIVRSYNLDSKEIFGDQFKGYFDISDFESLEEMGSFIFEICYKISLMIKRERMDSAKLLAEKTKAFIKEHYMESDISVESLCNYLHVSPAYFSTIFKKETGVNFITYLTDVRMEEAIKLLNTTDDKTYIISSKVGYTEPNYFSYVFKKHFGVSPSKYRNTSK